MLVTMIRVASLLAFVAKCIKKKSENGENPPPPSPGLLRVSGQGHADVGGAADVRGAAGAHAEAAAEPHGARARRHLRTRNRRRRPSRTRLPAEARAGSEEVPISGAGQTSRRPTKAPTRAGTKYFPLQTNSFDTCPVRFSSCHSDDTCRETNITLPHFNHSLSPDGPKEKRTRRNVTFGRCLSPKMDDLVVQSKALWELPWLYEEASSLAEKVRARTSRRRRHARRP